MHIKTCQGQFGLFSSALVKRHNLRPGGGMVDTRDLKSLASNGVRVRVPPRVFVVSKPLMRFIEQEFAALLTGRDSAHAGFSAGTLGGWNREMKQPARRARMPYDLPTIAEVMQASGYQTMISEPVW